MTLSSMVVSRDWSEVSVLECILGGLHIGVDVEPEPERAHAKLAKAKIDALIVDCDLDGTARFLQTLEDGLNTVPLLIISSPDRRAQVQDAGAAFVFEKPISVEQAVHKLSAARNLIMDGRLRYHRQIVDLPVSITCCPKKRFKATILNVSQGGVAICTNRPTPLSGTLRVEFKLPGSTTPFKLKGEVVWNRQGTAGIRFVEMPNRAKRQLHLWLGQQYLTR